MDRILNALDHLYWLGISVILVAGGWALIQLIKDKRNKK